MKRVTITFGLHDDVPPHVLDWMALNLREYIEHEFGCDYEPEWVTPMYDGPPMVEGTTDVQVAPPRAEGSEARPRRGAAWRVAGVLRG